MLVPHSVGRTDIEGVETRLLSRILGLERLPHQDPGEK
jgi:hypothetical protein